ncbi:hypothetical protein K1W69_25070 [Hoeflea sp. WL0058]|uniref:Uncharacterized protein n=1 Tax=Flavimaribacter sediminis TaxID=2865987 RepID=A0AAE2ZPR4_9HYPH|nr:hypothetical protein [Flavimaribacter sediminis]MBW8640488.1 hypothetical protein [Flavimaribacter sediminis]
MSRGAVAIVPATLRDVSYIVANLRPDDRSEIRCQVPPDAKPAAIAASGLAAGEAFVVLRGGQPSGAFGFAPISEGVLSAWAYGACGFERCIPAVTRFVFRELVDAWNAGGIRRIEARSIDSHTAAHRWLEATGARRRCALEQWGRNGERFLLYEWVRGGVPASVYRRWGHVLQHENRNTEDNHAATGQA